MRTIYKAGNYRIVEHYDEDANYASLKGDCFTPQAHMDTDAVDLLKQQEHEFEELVAQEGVYGFVLEKWNPEVGEGWTEVDSCWGFVGQYVKGQLTIAKETDDLDGAAADAHEFYSALVELFERFSHRNGEMP